MSLHLQNAVHGHLDRVPDEILEKVIENLGLMAMNEMLPARRKSFQKMLPSSQDCSHGTRLVSILSSVNRRMYRLVYSSPSLFATITDQMTQTTRTLFLRSSGSRPLTVIILSLSEDNNDAQQLFLEDILRHRHRWGSLHIPAFSTESIFASYFSFGNAKTELPLLSYVSVAGINEIYLAPHADPLPFAGRFVSFGANIYRDMVKRIFLSQWDIPVLTAAFTFNCLPLSSGATLPRLRSLVISLQGNLTVNYCWLGALAGCLELQELTIEADEWYPCIDIEDEDDPREMQVVRLKSMLSLTVRMRGTDFLAVRMIHQSLDFPNLTSLTASISQDHPEHPQTWLDVLFTASVEFKSVERSLMIGSLRRLFIDLSQAKIKERDREGIDRATMDLLRTGRCFESLEHLELHISSPVPETAALNAFVNSESFPSLETLIIGQGHLGHSVLSVSRKGHESGEA